MNRTTYDLQHPNTFSTNHNCLLGITLKHYLSALASRPCTNLLVMLPCKPLKALTPNQPPLIKARFYIAPSI